MDLKLQFKEDFLRNLNKIQTLKHECDFTIPDLTSEKKQFYWAILSACLCFEQMRAFESGLEKVILRDTGVNLNALYETLVKENESFNVNHEIVWDFMGKIKALQHFATKIQK